MNKEQKSVLLRTAAAAFIYAGVLIADKSGFLHNSPFGFITPIAYLVPCIVLGYDVLIEAFEEIKEKHFLDENFLMIVAAVGAFCIKEYSEAVAVFLFYKIGELFEDIATERSRKSVAALTEICPEYANLKTGDKITKINPADVKIGDIIIIKPGERIPLDCTVIDGISEINTSAVTGESLPVAAQAGTSLLSGCINGGGLLTATVTAEFKNSTVSRILELVENAADKKAPAEKFITEFAKYYTPAVVIGAMLLAFIPPLFGGKLSVWLYRACTFLVVSCPCALVISIPLSFFGGIGAASAKGILFKGSVCIEKFANLKTVIFDKTGTLTKGSFTVTEIHAESGDKKALLKLAAAVEKYSSHPIAKSVVASCSENYENIALSEIAEIPGKGVSARLDSKTVLAGNQALLKENGINLPDDNENSHGGTCVHIASDGKYLGFITVADELKPGTAQAVNELQRQKINTVMLTGDSKAAAFNIAQKLNITDIFYEMLPDGKVKKAREITENSKGGTVAFAGDGINDAPVLILADIGIAMGAAGSDAAIEAADIVLVEDDLQKIPAALKTARKTMKTVKSNIIFALSVKAAVLVLGACGAASLWAAVFADVGVTVLAILNAMRLLKTK